MSRIKFFLTASLMSMVFMSPVQAEVMTLQPLESARTSPSDCWGCCCGTSTASMNPASLSINSCTYQGGYCMGDSHKAAWIYEVPEMAHGATVTTMRIAGSRSGSYGSGALYVGWSSSSSLNANSIIDTMSNPDAVMSINWPASANYSFVVPSSIHADGNAGYLVVVAATSSQYGMTLVNSGANGARILMIIEEELCVGDFDESGEIDVSDVLHLLTYYGTNDSTCDLDENGIVNVNDLLLLLGGFGGCA